ncbi:hypothetical protein SLAV_35725 [Streptomyces lavendulae subsp. lavendulae]|uniref:Uncharacterized protein n=1 Tax=Streptomyces lavendulae subsp. lavendulae TaxID=58340 RepID=A0A2K8PQB1_STRLA|nr:hypothetical protein SLAV_35725 [Streptomyces lavendulae subsp. lavendulae]QUQ58739.1 hypothetical protein SLLC_33900 [Streptomyces lavendulae subsp. lavendulae]
MDIRRIRPAGRRTDSAPARPSHHPETLHDRDRHLRTAHRA